MAEIYKHYSEYTGPWPWKNFSPREVACKHCGELYIDHASMDALQKLRDALGKPIVINSGHRCRAHNTNIGGAPDSRHLKIAFDCRCPKQEQTTFCLLAVEVGFTGIGRYPERGFVHLDTWNIRSWWV